MRKVICAYTLSPSVNSRGHIAIYGFTHNLNMINVVLEAKKCDHFLMHLYVSE